jgi:hypothetical protein
MKFAAPAVNHCTAGAAIIQTRSPPDKRPAWLLSSTDISRRV